MSPREKALEAAVRSLLNRIPDDSDDEFEREATASAVAGAKAALAMQPDGPVTK